MMTANLQEYVTACVLLSLSAPAAQAEAPKAKDKLPVGAAVRLHEHKPGSISLHFTQKGKLVTTATAFNEPAPATVHVWDVKTWKLEKSFQALALRSAVHSPEFDPENLTYLRIAEDGTVEVRDLESGRLLRTLAEKLPKGKAYQSALSARGETLAVWDRAKTPRRFHFYDVASGKKLSEYVVGKEGVVDFVPAISPRGDWFVYEQRDNTLAVVDVQMGKLLRTFGKPYPPGYFEHVYLLHRFAPGGRFLVSVPHGFSEPNGALVFTVWDVQRGRAFYRIEMTPPKKSTAAAYWHVMSPDHRLLATFHLLDHGNRTVDVFEVLSGMPRRKFEHPGGAVTDVAFSPDARYLAIAGRDGSILLWDLRRPPEPAKFPRHLTKEELAGHWQALAERDARRADDAMWALALAPQDSLPLFRSQLRPRPSPSPQLLDQWIADLGSDSFRVRRRAAQELERLKEVSVSALQAALKRKLTLEMHQRVTQILERIDALAPLSMSLRESRALEVLERIGSGGARELLQTLAGGGAADPFTQEARRALARLDGQEN